MSTGSQVTINGVQYSIVDNKNEDNEDKNLISKATIEDRLANNKISSVKYNGKTYNVLTDADNMV